MADKPMVSLTQEQLQELLGKVAAIASENMNPLEKEKYQEQLDMKRRIEIFKSTVRSEVAAQAARMAGCSHSRWPSSAGKMGGHAAPRGQGEWATGGQIHGHGLLGLTCLRCGKGWFWMGSPQELDYAESAGLLNFPPPDDSRCLTACIHCSEFFTGKEVREHEKKCPKRLNLKSAEAVVA